MKMTNQEIRKTFLDYFIGKQHLLIKNASLIPENDPTLLLVNSGMAPLKQLFTGEKESKNPRLCNIQKCIRTNDIETIGDRHHLTFFEMMGNWSIGDYFKEEAINFAWELIKEVFNFDTSNLYATIYDGDKLLPNIPRDKESEQIWSKFLPAKQIIPLGADSNFWGPAGETGPCGPCTELFIDRGEKYGCNSPICGPDCDCDRFIEIWNAGVFMEYFLHDDGSLTELPLKSVDAGAGLDRFAILLQDVDSVYETDLLNPITEIFTLKKNLDSKSKSVRIMTDHIRCSTFMIADGIYPGNTKREYVLRRIIRRALLHANLSNTSPKELLSATNKTINVFSGIYSELTKNKDIILGTIEQEITKFNKTIDKGLKELDKAISKTQGNALPGEVVFKLHDTHGFHIDLTREIASVQGFTIDEEGFNNLLKKQKERSKQPK